MLELYGKYASAKVFSDLVGENAVSQIIELCSSPVAKDSKIRIMPDVHAGKGCTIGTTMTVTDKAIPNVVGVDIGCGMDTVFFDDENIDFQALDNLIRSRIPSGMAIRGKAHSYLSKIDLADLRCFDEIDFDRAAKSIGTLGGGNHFIEIDRDDDGRLYLVIHSGSRNLGLQVANYYQLEAYARLNNASTGDLKLLATILAAEGKKNSEIKRELKKARDAKTTDIPKHMAYCEGYLFDSYLNDIAIIQKYADLNRKAMADEIINGLGLKVAGSFTTIHNYIDVENKILRKGAVSAALGERLLIPMNMRDGSLICVGKGNEDWNYSAPHGAGRLLSRSEAKKAFTLEEYEAEMQGIYSTSIHLSTIDESPMAYKPMDDIVKNIEPTVSIEKIIKPLYNYKAGGG